MIKSSNHYRRQRGALLFMILLAVVLFAALSYAVTQSIRSGGKDGSKEDYQAAASVYLQYFSSIDTALQRLNLVQGIAFENISFGHDSYHYGSNGALVNYMNNTQCLTDACRVFKAAGGAVAPPLGTYPLYMGTPAHTWAVGTPILLIQWPGAGTALSDVVLVFPLMKVGVCREINAAANITAIPIRGGTTSTANTPSTWDSAPPITISAGTSAGLIGRDTFATDYSASSKDTDSFCSIFHLLIAR